MFNQIRAEIRRDSIVKRGPANTNQMKQMPLEQIQLKVIVLYPCWVHLKIKPWKFQILATKVEQQALRIFGLHFLN